MSIIHQHNGLFTDHYELVMAEGYYLSGLADYPVCFDYFFRKNPFNGGYVVFAGLSDLLSNLKHFVYDENDCKYLEDIGFKGEFVDYLKGFQFQGNIISAKEGEIVFPGEPVLRVEGGLAETQLIETMVLNVLNFESLIATKASRMRYAAGEKSLMDFGLRRAQGWGGIHASKAAIIGGFDQTSNVYSAFEFGLTSSGTMAHSWIQNFEDELTAFRTFAQHFPENCILLVDTYDTLKSGMPNAIKVATEMKKKGQKLKGIRLDSGDLAYLAREARSMMDQAGLNEVKIIASNQLDEFVIQSLERQDAPIDIYGVGTALVTGKDDPALDGVYKLCMSNYKASMKFSENEKKETLPGIKRIERFYDQNNGFFLDGIALDFEKKPAVFHHPYKPGKSTRVDQNSREQIHHCVMTNGKLTEAFSNGSVEAVSGYRKERFGHLGNEYKRFENPHEYKVGISDKLKELKIQIKRGM